MKLDYKNNLAPLNKENIQQHIQSPINFMQDKVIPSHDDESNPYQRTWVPGVLINYKLVIPIDYLYESKKQIAHLWNIPSNQQEHNKEGAQHTKDAGTHVVEEQITSKCRGSGEQ